MTVNRNAKRWIITATIMFAALLILFYFTSLTFVIVFTLVCVYVISPMGKKHLWRLVFRLRTDNNTLIFPLYILSIAVPIIIFSTCRFEVTKESSFVSQASKDKNEIMNLYLRARNQGKQLPQKTDDEGVLCPWWLFFVSLSAVPTAIGYNIYALRDEFGNLVKKAERKIFERKNAQEDLPDVRDRTTTTVTPPNAQEVPQTPRTTSNVPWGSNPITRRDFFSFEFLELILGVAREFLGTSFNRGMRGWRPLP